jgi:hypothetical protein
MTIDQEIDELVRDLTKVGSLPKSEARRRIKEIYEKGRKVKLMALVDSFKKD